MAHLSIGPTWWVHVLPEHLHASLQNVAFSTVLRWPRNGRPSLNLFIYRLIYLPKCEVDDIQSKLTVRQAGLVSALNHRLTNKAKKIKQI